MHYWPMFWLLLLLLLLLLAIMMTFDPVLQFYMNVYKRVGAGEEMVAEELLLLLLLLLLQSLKACSSPS